MKSLGLVCISTASVLGCAVDELTEPHEREVTCTTLDNRSLIETSPRVDDLFSLERVFEQIAATTPRVDGGRRISVPSARTMFEQLYYAYGMCEGHGVDPAHYGLACRPETTLGSLDPFTGAPDALRFEASALLNRFDLAGENASSCGEARIVYWMAGGPIEGKAGFIVELAVPPVVKNGRRSCRPIIDLWASLSSEPDEARRIARLAHFYFHGLPGMAYPPVHAFAAGWYGAGQLRSNNFVDTAQWNLREVKWQPECDARGCQARFALVDSKNSPSQLLFAGSHAGAAAFQTWFVDEAVPKLAAARSIHELSLGSAPEYDAYESISQPRDGDPSSVTYATAASASLTECITGKLHELGSSLTATNILDRATATTCAGCHRVSRGADLGDGVAFPMFTGFIHVGEQGLLSSMMSEVFLPQRLRAFQQLACTTARLDAPVSAPIDTTTIMGKAMSEPE